MSVNSTEVGNRAIAIGDLDDLQYLLLWQKEYVFNALTRAELRKESAPDLYNLYYETHARNIFDDIEDEVPLPLSRDCVNETSDFLCGSHEQLPLSIVATSRNDCHVERMEERTQAFIDSIYFLAEKFEKNVELIIVEWNPPVDRPQMAEAFNFPATHPYVSSRILTVSSGLHSQYIWSDGLPLYQMIAKNVGIRRARGKQILATNVDILLSEELFRKITMADLPNGKIYRSNRWDVDRSILDLPTSQKQLEQARGLHFQVNYREGIYPAGSHPAPISKDDDGVIVRYESTNVFRLHTEACGDFQMLHRDDWLRVRGYSELDAYSFHLDSLFALTCHHAGIEEVVFDEPHFHIDHTLGVKVKADSYEINEKKVIKHISMPALCVLDAMQSKVHDFFYTNDANWGLAPSAIPDEVMTLAGWDGGYSTQGCGSLVGPSSLTNLDKLGQLLDASTVQAYVNKVWAHTVAYIKQKADGRPISVWGGGKRGAFAVQALEERGVPVDMVVHGGDGKHYPGIKSDLVVLADSVIDNHVGSAFIVISSVFADEIVGLLSKNGWREGDDYIVSI